MRARPPGRPFRFLLPILAAAVFLLAGLTGSGPPAEAQADGNFTIGVTLGAATLNENAGRTEIAVDLELSQAQDTDTTVSIQHTHGAADAADYSFTGASVTIPAGQRRGSGTVRVTPRSDDIVEGPESFTVAALVDGAEKGAAGISILDDDQATLSISGPSEGVTEGSVAEFTVTLSHAVGAAVTAAWSVGSGSATAGSDVTPTSGTVTFAAGSGAGATQSISIAVTDDSICEDAEDFSVSLGAITGDLASLVSLKSDGASATATIPLNDLITISVSGPSSVTEGETPTYTISLSPPGVIPPAGANLAVNYFTVAGTATQLNQNNRNVADYDWKNVIHTFNADSPGPAEVPVATFDDSRVEQDETFSFKISEGYFAMSGHDARLRPRFGTSSLTTTIVNDDVSDRDIFLSIDPPALAEDDDPMTFTVTATLKDETPATADIPVAIKLGGTATVDSDYTVQTALSSITIPENSSSGSGTLVINPIDDTVVEPHEFISLSGSATDLTVEPADIVLVSQMSDRAKLSISGPSEEVEEGSGAVITAILSNLVSAEVTVEWRGQSPDCCDFAEPSDYGNVQVKGRYPRGYFTIPANTFRHTFVIPVNDDNLAEPVERFAILTGVISPAGLAADAISAESSTGDARAFATIAESDPITVNLSGPAVVNEAGGNAVYTVSLTGGVPIEDLTVNYATADGTAAAGSDYTAASGTLTFTPEDHADRTITVRITDDTLEEGDETFTVALNSVAGGGGPAPALGASSVTTTIREAPPAPALTVSGPTAPSYQENGASAVASYTTDPSNAGVSWTLEGTDAADFSISGSGQLSFRQSPDFEAPADADTDNRYEVTVKATSSGESATLAVTIAVADVEENTGPPGRVTGLTATAAVHDTISLSWTAPGDGAEVTGYRILRRAVESESSFQVLVRDTGSTGTTWTDDSSVLPRTKYAYRVRALGDHGAGQLSMYANVITPAAPRPGQVTGLAATATAHDTVSLSWSAPGDGAEVTGYRILRRALDSETSLQVLVEDTGSTGTTWTDNSNVSPRTKYAYRVQALSDHGAGQLSMYVNATTPAAPPPGRVTGLTATADAHDTVSLSWSAPGDGAAVTGYRILRRAVDSESSFQALVQDTGNTGTTWTDNSNVSPRTKYAYRVQALGDHGVGQRSKFASVITPAAPN